MIAVTGITGQVGSAVARNLLKKGQGIRAVVRDAGKGEEWKKHGCEIALADFGDVDALAKAFAGVESVFVMIPAYFAPSPGFTEARAVLDSLRQALERARPPKIVCLSSVGAQHDRGLGLITQLYLLEQALGESAPAIAFLRAAWFMENAAWDVASARDGKISSFLFPTDRAIPMIATGDIGRIGAEILQQAWNGIRVLELEGPRPVSPNDLAAAFSQALNREVKVEPVARETWSGLFCSQGTADPAPRIEMLDGFNSGWISFEGRETIRGKVTLDEVIRTLVAKK